MIGKTMEVQRSTFKGRIFFAILSLFWPCIVFAEVHATVTLQPPEITLGESAQLNIVMDGSATVSPPGLPNVPDLEFNYVGQSARFQFVNGTMSGGVTFIYQVTPRKEGIFTIPAISVTIGKTIINTNPVSLTVKQSSSSYSLPSSSPQQKSAPSSSAPTVFPEMAMIQLNCAKRNFYVGELVPMDLKIYLREGLQVSAISPPALLGTAFIVGKLSDKPEQTSEVIRGVPYTVLAWHTAVAAVKAGEHLLDAQLECTILVRDQHRRRAPLLGGDLFDDPFFGDFFWGLQEKRVMLRTSDTTVKVLPLPLDGRPNDFSGAIGQFHFMTEALPKEVVAGDPITLKMKVTGTGNFDRVQAPEFPNSTGFKTYQPSAKLEPSAEDRSESQKVFEQVIIPQTTEIKQIPPIHFSFFNPETHKYETLISTPVPIQVSQGSLAGPNPFPTTVQGTVPVSSSFSLPNTSKIIADLLPNKLEIGTITSRMTPLIWAPWFWGIQSVSMLAWAVVWILARRRERLVRDPEFARAVSANRTVRIHLDAMNIALKQGDATAFFHAARKALQVRLSQYLGIKPETITPSEMKERLSWDSSLVESVQKVFEAADANAYSGQDFRSETLYEWKHAIEGVLRRIEEIK